MRIEGFRTTRTGDRLRASARVSWERTTRPSFDLWFETGVEFGDSFAANPDAFLTACWLPAIRHGEPRVFVAGATCPRLREGLETAARWLAASWGPPREPIPIESEASLAPFPPRLPRPALFLTTGIDSLALLRGNRRRFPPGHSERFEEAVHVVGLLFSGRLDSLAVRLHLERQRTALSEISRDARVAVVECMTNLRELEPDQMFLADEWISAALAAVAHTFAGRWSSVTFASGRDIAHLQPRGTHPILDPCYSTAATEIRHEGILFSRLAKLREVAEWDAGVRNLAVCFDLSSGAGLNCGRCEKCLRTMAELTAVGRLDAALEFSDRRLRPEAIRALSLTPLVLDYWEELVPMMLAGGQTAIARAIEDRLEVARRARQWHEDRNWSGRLRRFDRRWLGGRLLRVSRRLRGSNPGGLSRA